MNIGIDIDGVLADIYGYQIRTSKPYFEKLGYTIVDPTGFDVADIYGCTQKERSDFWHKYIWKYCIFEPPIPIIPVRINGAREIYPPEHKLPSTKKTNGRKQIVEINLGAPIYPENRTADDITDVVRKYIGHEKQIFLHRKNEGDYIL